MLRVVVMGVAGAGKTTVGRALAARLGARFVDADDAHPPANLAKMAAGIPLTDADREPWLDRLRAELAGHDRIVVTCSALKRAYRDRLRDAGGVRFAFLDVDADEATRRVATRADHFMGAGMVDSQFAALERPTDDERDVIVVDARADVPSQMDAIVARLEGDRQATVE